MSPKSMSGSDRIVALIVISKSLRCAARYALAFIIAVVLSTLLSLYVIGTSPYTFTKSSNDSLTFPLLYST